jgi:hypothetical protein
LGKRKTTFRVKSKVEMLYFREHFLKELEQQLTAQRCQFLQLALYLKKSFKETRETKEISISEKHHFQTALL